MVSFVCNVFYVFFLVLEVILFLYIFLSWIPSAGKIRGLFYSFLEPLFTPIRFTLRHSVFQTVHADMTPMIALLVISFGESLFYTLRLY